MKTALVTGANGFVGSHLVERLVASKKYSRVIALVRKGSSVANLKDIACEFAHGEITKKETLLEQFSDVDVVFHVAGAVREKQKGDFDRINREGTKNVAEACLAQEKAPLLILVSSQAAMGPAEQMERPSIESDTPSPISRYGRSKLGGETEVRKSGLVASIVRPPIVYGPRDTDFYDVFKMAKRGLVFKPGFSVKRYSIVHAADLADAIIDVAERGKRISSEDVGQGVYFVTDGPVWTWEEMAKLTGKALAKRPTVLPVPTVTTWILALILETISKITKKPAIVNFDKVIEIYPNTWICSSDAVRREVGWTPRFPLAEGLQHTADWYKAQGLL